jgi:hypothetical protein
MKTQAICFVIKLFVEKKSELQKDDEKACSLLEGARELMSLTD